MNLSLIKNWLKKKVDSKIMQIVYENPYSCVLKWGGIAL